MSPSMRPKEKGKIINEKAQTLTKMVKKKYIYIYLCVYMYDREPAIPVI